MKQRDPISTGWCVALAGMAVFCFMIAGPLALFWAFLWWLGTGR